MAKEFRAFRNPVTGWLVIYGCRDARGNLVPALIDDCPDCDVLNSCPEHQNSPTPPPILPPTTIYDCGSCTCCPDGLIPGVLFAHFVRQTPVPATDLHYP